MAKIDPSQPTQPNPNNPAIPRDADGNPINTPQTAAGAGAVDPDAALGGPNADQARRTNSRDSLLPLPDRNPADTRSEAERQHAEAEAKLRKEIEASVRREFADKQRSGASLGPLSFDVPKHPDFQDDKGNQKPGLDLLMTACNRYGINPDPRAVPLELLNWKHYAAGNGVPEHVVLVTAGGLKISEPIEADKGETEARLRQALGAFRRTSLGELLPIPLPSAPVLPSEAVTGYPRARVGQVQASIANAIVQSHGRS